MARCGQILYCRESHGPVRCARRLAAVRADDTSESPSESHFAVSLSSLQFRSPSLSLSLPPPFVSLSHSLSLSLPPLSFSPTCTGSACDSDGLGLRVRS